MLKDIGLRTILKKKNYKKEKKNVTNFFYSIFIFSHESDGVKFFLK